jgi:hypothetical protein
MGVGYNQIHTSPTRWIELQHNLQHWLVRQDYSLPYTGPGCTHIVSWLHYFHGWSLVEPVLRFGYDNNPRTTGYNQTQSWTTDYNQTKFSFLSPQILISRILTTLKNKSLGDKKEIIEQNSTQTQINSCKAKQYYPYTNYPIIMLRLQGRINQV